MWPFTRKGGLSKFHAGAIFTLQGVKWKNIIGMWVKFLLHAVNTAWKKSWPEWNVSRREKVIARVKIFHAVKKVIAAVKHFTLWKVHAMKFNPWEKKWLCCLC